MRSCWTSASATLNVAATDPFNSKTTQLLFEVVYDVEGGRTRTICLDCLENKALGNETSPGTSRFVKAQKTHQQKEKHYAGSGR